jgi:transposase
MKTGINHPLWALKYRKPGTELKFINGRYYLYGVKSVYDQTIKRSRKVSLGILGSITEEDGFTTSEKNKLKKRSGHTYLDKQLMVFEYGFAKWLIAELENSGLMNDLKVYFPAQWKFIVFMVYCRIAYKSPLKNIPFDLEQSAILDLLDWKEKVYDQKISDMLFELGSMQQSIHEFMKPRDNRRRTVLMDATDVALQSGNINLAQKGYNSNMDFQPQFVLLYLYDALTLEPLYYRLLPGNIREVSAMGNTIKISGMEQCVYIADKGFFSQTNIAELEEMSMQYIIPLKRDNKLIPYEAIANMEQSDNYFRFSKRFIFHADTKNLDRGKIDLFLDGKLKEQEKTDYLSRIQSLPENFSKLKFNEKLQSMGTLALLHNTALNPQNVYLEYKSRGETEQFFDHLKNTIDASCSHMQRPESLNGWMFINHISMQTIYRLFQILKTTPLNKKQKLIHRYSINDTIEHLKTVKRIKFSPNECVTSEINKSTKILLKQMKISIT